MMGRTADTSIVANVRYKGVVRAVRVRCEDCPAFECFELERRFILKTREELFACGTHSQHGCPAVPARALHPWFGFDGGVWARPRKPKSRMIA